MLTVVTQTIAWMVIFFFASAAASSAYLTVSESFPLEIRALAIAVFYAFGTALGGIIGPAFFGRLIDTHQRSEVFFGLSGRLGADARGRGGRGDLGRGCGAQVARERGRAAIERRGRRRMNVPTCERAADALKNARPGTAPRVRLPFLVSTKAAKRSERLLPAAAIGDVRKRQTLTHRLLALAQHRIEFVDVAIMAERNDRDHVDVGRQLERRCGTRSDRNRSSDARRDRAHAPAAPAPWPPRPHRTARSDSLRPCW